MRAEGAEVALPTFQAFADTDPLNRRIVEQMLIGGVTRQYRRSLESIGADVRTRATSKSAVSLWDGSTQNATVSQSLLADLQSRGLRTDRSLSIILDGSKALHKAVTQAFGPGRADPALPGA